MSFFQYQAGALPPSLALDASNNPIVAWQDDASGNSEVYVRRYDGQGWSEMGPGSASGGGVSNSGSASTGPTLGYRAGLCRVAWMDAGPTSMDIYVRGIADPNQNVIPEPGPGAGSTAE